MEQLIECVPNFSEGLDLSIIKQITDECEKVDGIKLLNVDPGKTTNRTVVTFVGNPQAVIDAAFNAIKKAASSTIPAMIAKKIVDSVKDREGKKKGGIIKKADMITEKMSMKKKGKMMKSKR